jgi:4-alpha-glucanotransferase
VNDPTSSLDVDEGYLDVGGTWHPTDPGVRAALVEAAGPEVPSPPLWFVRAGESPALQRPAIVDLEDGTELGVVGSLPPDLPIGYHDLHPDDGGPTTRLVIAPQQAAGVATQLRAVAVQVYAARSRASWGIGDLGDVAALARWSAGLGAGALLLSPLHAPMPVPDPDPSPYYASSRIWRNPLHLRIEDVPGWDPGDPELVELAQRGRALDGRRTIDRGSAWWLKRTALERLWRARPPAGRRFARWRSEQGQALTRYATFCALAEHHRSGWGSWPAEHRRPDAPAVARFAAEHADVVAFHAWLQWLLDGQHAAAAAAAPGVGLVHDLAVGADPGGADAWLWQDLLAPGVRVGAPPDEFGPAGQDWGLPPFIPGRLRAAAYEPLAELFRAALRHSAGLRVDHVMGLFRLWWIPPGRGAADGAYVRYRSRELLDVLAIESVRAGAFVVGEDLGTVEGNVRAELADRGILGYRVAWFEEAPPASWPGGTLASMTTHDLPTVAGVWSGTDDPDGKLSPRLAALVGEPWPATADQAVARAHTALHAAGSAIAAATLEDLLVVPDRPNHPGTTTERNWSVALPTPIDDLDATPAPGLLRALTAEPPDAPF